MQIETRFLGVVRSAALVDHLRRRVGFSLGRFFDRIERLVVRFEDVNGPRGGRDKICRVEAIGAFGVRRAEAHGEDLYAVAHRALDVIERSVARAIQRRRLQACEAPSPRGRT